MNRFRLLVEYDGTGYVGWQRQDNGPSIQQAIEEAVFAFCGERTNLAAAGRTDAGVHAMGQVAHVDLDRATKADTLRDAVNFHLKPQAISILAAEPVGADFHARFSATGRRYLYRIVNRRPDLTLRAGHAWRVPRPLDAAAMQAAAQCLTGKHDFTTFRSTECQAASPLKTLQAFDVQRHGDELAVTASARSFLHTQVRSMVGSLVAVGEGKWSADDLANALATRDRTACGQVAPPDGLYLMQVDYAAK